MAEYSYEQVMTALRNADAAGDTEAATRLASIANSYKSQKPVEEPSYGFKEGLTDLAKGTVGTVAGLADLAVGLPKMAASSIAAPIRTAIYGDSNTQRQVSQQAAEDIFGTPSAGLAKLGVPEEYLQGSKSYQTMMKPFELLAEGVEAGGNKISDVTGNRELGGTAKQLADVALLAAPIPGINLAKRGVAKLLEPFSGAKDAATLKREMGYTSSAAESILKAREEAAAKAQPVPKQPIPEEVTTGAQMDLFRETPEQILARQREQAAGESWGIQRDAQREQGDLFIEAGKEPLQRIIPEDRTPAEIEAAYAQREAQRQAEFDLASERMRVQNEPLELEPTQRSQTAPPEDQVPLGQRGFGRGQRGAIDPDVFLKDFPEFVNSKVVNALGKLAQVYHGTTEEIKGEFKTYKGFKNFYKDVGGLDKDGFIRTPERAYSGDIGTWFSSTPKGTDTFAGARTGVKGGNVHPVYLNLKNPKVFETHGDYIKWFNSVTEDGSSASKARRSLIKQGHDGIQIKDSRTDAGGLRTDWVAFHPQQIESTLSPTRPIGQTKVGKSQRGSIGFFGKDPFEKFADDIRAELPDATTQEIQKAWEDKQKFEQLVAAEQAKATGLGNMGKKVGHELSNYLSVWKDKPQEEVLNVIKQTDDNADTSLGFVSNNLLSKGRLGVVRHENAGIRDGISHMINNIDNNRIVGNKLLNDHQTGVNAAARKLETLHGEGDAYAVFEQIFAKQEDPNFQFNLKPDQQKLLTRIKETTDKIWDDMTSTVAKLSPEKAERLSRMKQEWYMPHQFFGDFVSYVRDADGRLLTYIAETSQKEAQRAVEHLRSQLGSEYKIDDAVYVGGKQKALGKKAQDAQRGAAMQEGFAGQFDYMIDLLGSDDPAVQKAQKAVQSVINRRALASEGMRNRMKVNTNVGGSVGNKPWKSQRENYFDAKKSFESYVNSFYEWKGNMENAEFLAKVKDTAPDKVNTYATLKEQMQLMSGLGDQNKFTLVDEAGNRFAKTFGVSPKTINEGARAIGNYETMITTGFYNPVMLYQNFVQSPLTQITTMGQIAAHGGSWNPVRATGYIMSSVLDSLLLGKTNKEWLKYAEEHEISVPGLIESHGKTKIGSASKEYIIAKGTQVSEQTSRLGFFYGMTKYLMETGLKEAEALEVAKNMTRDYMGNYERYARPGLLTRTGAGGELFGRLQVFTANAFTQFAQITADMAKGIRENNPKLIVPFAAIIATQYLVGGINGTIPMDVAEKLHWASVKAGVIPPEWRSPRQYMLQEHPKVAVSPQSQFIGDWFEGSFRGSVPFTSAPAPQKLVEQLSEIPTAIKWVGDFLTGSNTVSSLDKARLATSVLPASGRGAIEKEFLMGKQGVMVSKNTGAPMYQMPKKEQEDFTSNTNIRSFNRGITTELESLEFSRNQRVNDRRKKIDQQFQEKIADTVNRGEKLDSNFFKESIKRDFELGGDPDLLVRRAFEKAVQANLPNAVVAEIIRDEKNPFKKQRMLQTYKAIQEGTK